MYFGSYPFICLLSRLFTLTRNLLYLLVICSLSPPPYLLLLLLLLNVLAFTRHVALQHGVKTLSISRNTRKEMLRVADGVSVRAAPKNHHCQPIRLNCYRRIQIMRQTISFTPSKVNCYHRISIMRHSTKQTFFLYKGF